MRSPLGLYYCGGVVVHSDDGPQDAVRWVGLNEGHVFVDMVGAIQPDSSVTFGSGHPVLCFNVKTRKLQVENTCKGKIVFMAELVPSGHWSICYTPCNAFGLRLTAAFSHKLDALMAAFEQLQKD